MESSAYKSSGDADFVETGSCSAAATFDPDVLKRLKLKADFILLPMLTFAYLLKYVHSLSPLQPPEVASQLTF